MVDKALGRHQREGAIKGVITAPIEIYVILEINRLAWTGDTLSLENAANYCILQTLLSEGHHPEWIEEVLRGNDLPETVLSANRIDSVKDALKTVQNQLHFPSKEKTA